MEAILLLISMKEVMTEQMPMLLFLEIQDRENRIFLKLLLLNLREQGMSLITLDPEHEYEEVTYNLGGVFY